MENRKKMQRMIVSVYLFVAENSSVNDQQVARVENNNVTELCRKDSAPVVKLPYLRCDLTGTSFVMDSGYSNSMMAITNVVPDKFYEVTALTANHRKLRVYGEITMEVKFSGMRMKYLFLVSDTKRNLIGFDFLQHFHLYYDFVSYQTLQIR